MEILMNPTSLNKCPEKCMEGFLFWVQVAFLIDLFRAVVCTRLGLLGNSPSG